jgi:hypothetical protein
LIKRITDSGVLVLDDSNNPNPTYMICRIKQIELAANLANTDNSSTNPEDYHRIILSQAPNIPSPPLGFWFVPADAASGRSPCIEVQSRMYRLQ